ncbi:hypothetical protein MSTE_01809 [Mycobacteroides stephanolepidis]|uniref:Uncharacterized protein n=1 Tax=[Mycobacterium] stephanolepidis TaxID=1520670 RepID=A0A1Z4EVX4_9MYCO|nr:hypothetical protein [[Mycobacterium] stephanolepidis]BAX97126.1 hypothetical protein MSTE_01809 [[Mycobacterium] stephanolepidis]
MSHPTPDPDIRAAILNALTDEYQPWAAVRRRIPGSDETLTAVLHEMFEDYRLTLMKISGSPIVRLVSDLDLMGAAAERDRLRQMGWPRSRCREFLAV